MRKYLLIVFLSSLFFSCSKAKLPIDECVSNPPKNGFDCVSVATGKKFFILYASTNDWVCTIERDALFLKEVCENKGGFPVEKIVLCFSNPNASNMLCTDNNNVHFKVPYHESKSMRCMPLDQFYKAAEYCAEIAG